MVQLPATKGGEGRKLEQYDQMKQPEQWAHLDGRVPGHIFQSETEEDG